MSFLSSLSQDDSHIRMKLAVRIEGVPFVFVEETIVGATFGVPSATFTQLEVIDVEGIEEGETSLDLEKRSEKGATLDVTLVDDDERSLRNLFAHAADRVGFVNSDRDESDTAIELNDVTPFGSGDVLYIGSETIVVGSTGGGELLGVTRGAFGSKASKLYGVATGAVADGDSVYATVPAWQGRRAYLFGYIKSVAGVEQEQLLSTWLVDESPENIGDIRWRLRLGGIAREFYARTFCAGVRAAKVVTAAVSSVSLVDGITYKSWTVDDAKLLRMSTGNLPTHVLVEGLGFVQGEGSGTSNSVMGIYRLLSTDGLNTVEFSTMPEFAIDGRQVFIFTPQSVRPIFCLGSNAAAFLSALLSREGQGANTWDLMPGRDSTSYDAIPWRIGAGFDTSEIDTASFLAVSPPAWFKVFDRDEMVEDVLAEYCRMTSSFTRVSADGRLTLVPTAERIASPFVFDANVVDPDVEPSVVLDEGALTPMLSVKSTYDPMLGDFCVEMNLVDANLLKRYPRNQRRREIEMSMRAVALDGLPPTVVRGLTRFANPVTITLADLADNLAREIQRGEGGIGRRFVTMATTFAALSVELGDVVQIDGGLPEAFSGLPDFTGGVIAGKRMRVVGRRRDWNKGRITFRLEIIDDLLVVCPAAVIASAAGATMTLATTGPEVSGASPELDFWVGAKVIVYDVSGMAAGTPGSAQEIAISSILSGPPRLVLASAPTFAVQAGVDYLVLAPSTSASGTSASGYTLSEMATTVDSSGVSTPTAPEVNPRPRWQ